MVTLCMRDWIRERISCRQLYSDSVLASGLPDTPAGPLALSGLAARQEASPWPHAAAGSHLVTVHESGLWNQGH